jgi:hypothetical protein
MADEVQSNFAELAGQFGVDTGDIGITKPLQNKSAYYEYALGSYQGLLSKLTEAYINKEKKKCKKGDPGATLSHGTLRIIIFKDPEKVLIGSDLALPEEPYGRLVFSQYIPLDENRQWQNVRLLSDLTYNGLPQADIIQGKKGQEEVHLANLVFFAGAPIKFDIVNSEKNPDSRFIANLELLDHATLTKETLDKRKQIVGTLETSLQAYLERLKKENAKKSDEPAPSDADNPEEFIPDFE